MLVLEFAFVIQFTQRISDCSDLFNSDRFIAESNSLYVEHLYEKNEKIVVIIKSDRTISERESNTLSAHKKL